MDVIYAATPLYLYLNPDILGYLLKPLLDYQESPLYHNPYSARDIGSLFHLPLWRGRVKFSLAKAQITQWLSGTMSRMMKESNVSERILRGRCLLTTFIRVRKHVDNGICACPKIGRYLVASWSCTWLQFYNPLLSDRTTYFSTTCWGTGLSIWSITPLYQIASMYVIFQDVDASHVCSGKHLHQMLFLPQTKQISH